MKAGYSVVDFSNVAVNLATATGSVTVNNIDADTMTKLRDLSKPVLIQNLTIVANGANIQAVGFTHHIVSAGVHTHTIQGISMSPIGDNQLTIEVVA